MMTFMIGVLGSIIFWILYAIFSFFMAIITMEKIGMAKTSYAAITTGLDREGASLNVEEILLAVLIIPTHIIFWPLILICYLSWIIVCAAIKLSIKSLGTAFIRMEKMIPDAKITFPKKKSGIVTPDASVYKEKISTAYSNLTPINPDRLTNNLEGRFLVNSNQPYRYCDNDPMPAIIKPHDGLLFVKWVNGCSTVVGVTHLNIWEMDYAAWEFLSIKKEHFPLDPSVI